MIQDFCKRTLWSFPFEQRRSRKAVLHELKFPFILRTAPMSLVINAMDVQIQTVALQCQVKQGITSPVHYSYPATWAWSMGWTTSMWQFRRYSSNMVLNRLSHMKWWKGDANQEHIDSVSTSITHCNSWSITPCPPSLPPTLVRTMQWKMGLLVIPISPLTQTHFTAHSGESQAVLWEMLIEELNKKRKTVFVGVSKINCVSLPKEPFNISWIWAPTLCLSK